MRRSVFRILFLLMTLLSVSVFPSFAQASVEITSFTSTATLVGRSALTGRTARIPVSWATANRPLTANLFFEQVLPDGATINVELPRVIPFVASAGDGIAAPILPNGEVSSITLRVSLINLFTNFVYDSQEIVIAVVDGNSGGDGSGYVPALTAFNVRYTAPVNRTELNNGTVRLPVSWTAINRPNWTNLIFEQVLPDGTVHNVELPRPFSWVNSSDNGMVAPVSVGNDANQIVLRVRLADVSLNRTYDQLYAYIPIQTTQNAPDITSFSTTTNRISADVVRGGIARIDVSWAVSNRPNGTNLVFEQILPDGTVRNAELPRNVLIVPSTGYGVVAPILPSQSAAELIFRLRLVDLSNNSTLDSQQLTVLLTDVDVDTDTDTPIVINTFSVDKNSTAGNTQVTFSWDISGDFRDAYIEFTVQFNPESIFTVTSNTGSHAYTIPNWVWADEKTVTLVVEDEFGAVIRRELTMTVTCTWQWNMTVAETGCPGEFVSRTGAYQQFQRGFMIWLPNNAGNAIYIFYDGGSADARSDTWDGSEFTIDGTPPDSLIAPERGFGYLWNTTPAIRSGLGWASGAEQSYSVNTQGRFQFNRNDPTVNYYSLPDGRIIRLNSTGGLYPTRTWSFVE